MSDDIQAAADLALQDRAIVFHGKVALVPEGVLERQATLMFGAEAAVDRIERDGQVVLVFSTTKPKKTKKK